MTHQATTTAAPEAMRFSDAALAFCPRACGAGMMADATKALKVKWDYLTPEGIARSEGLTGAAQRRRANDLRHAFNLGSIREGEAPTGTVGECWAHCRDQCKAKGGGTDWSMCRAYISGQIDRAVLETRQGWHWLTKAIVPGDRLLDLVERNRKSGEQGHTHFTPEQADKRARVLVLLQAREELTAAAREEHEARRNRAARAAQAATQGAA